MAKHKVAARSAVTTTPLSWPEKSSRLDRLSARIGTIHAAIAIAIVLVASIWVSDGGLLHPESLNFLADHLSKRPMWPLIFDSRVLDNGMYQARELSYVLDRLDCYFIAFSTALGFPHFVSLTHYTFSFFIGIFAWLLCVRYFHLDRLVSLLLVLLVITSPTLFLDGFYLRSAKIAVTLMMAVMALDIARSRTLHRNQGWSYSLIGRGAVFMLLCLIMALLDRQGFFFAVLLAAFFAIDCILAPGPLNYVYLLASATACLLDTIYNHWLAPTICNALNGYWPSMDYQHLSWTEFWSHGREMIDAGCLLFINEVGFFAGDLPFGIAICLCIGIAVVIGRYRHVDTAAGQRVPLSARKWLGRAIVPLLMLSLIAMNSLMYFRHRPVMLEDIQRLYYWTPQTLLLMILAGIALGMLQQNGFSIHAARLVLALLLFSSIIALPFHWKYVRYGHHVDSYPLGAAYRASLRQIGKPGAVPADIAQSPTFRAIENRALEFRRFFGMATPEDSVR